ncbi:MAG: hypothetical protein C0475_03895 [Planctomyces sp.]|nr:hypothetical protein [Planctomyces sp.]
MGWRVGATSAAQESRVRGGHQEAPAATKPPGSEAREAALDARAIRRIWGLRLLVIGLWCVVAGLSVAEMAIVGSIGLNPVIVAAAATSVVALAPLIAWQRRLDLRLRARLERARHDKNVLDMILDNTEAVIFVKDLRGRYTLANRVLTQRIVGQDIVGMTDDELFEPDVAAIFKEADRAVLRTGEPQTRAYMARIRGRSMCVADSKFVLPGPDGEPTGIGGIAVDVTELYLARQALAQSEERLALAMRGTAEGMWEYDASTRAYFFSERLRQMCALPAGDGPVTAAGVLACVHADDADRLERAARAHVGSRAAFDERARIRTAQAEGGYRWYRVRGQAAWEPDGTLRRFAGSVSDIHEATLAEQRLRTTLGQLAEALEREQGLARELNHRVRNNLTALMGLIGLYARSARTPEVLAEALRTKVLAVREVYDLIAGAPSAAVRLDELLTTIARAVTPGTGDGGPVRLAIDGPRVQILPSAVSALGMVLQELFSNALKHGSLGKDGGKIHVRWEPQAHDGSLLLAWAEHGATDAPAEAEAAAQAPHTNEGRTGLELISGFARAELAGSLTWVIQPSGFTCQLRIGKPAWAHAPA